MEAIIVEKVCKEHKDLINEYFKNNGKKIYAMIDKILFKLKFNVEKSDFYSLGSEIFLDALCRYDKSKSFDGFLYSCLMNKFKTEMTKRNRQKRMADSNAISIDAPIGEDECTLADMIASNIDIEKEIIGSDEDIQSDERIERYLDSLSRIQRKIITMKMQDIEVQHIKKELNLTDKQYSDYMQEAIQYEHIRLLHI